MCYTNLNVCSTQAEEAGLPPVPDRFDSSEIKLKTSQNILNGLQAEEAAGTAKLETDLDNNLSEQERKQLSEKMKDHLVGILDTILLYEVTESNG